LGHERGDRNYRHPRAHGGSPELWDRAEYRSGCTVGASESWGGEAATSTWLAHGVHRLVTALGLRACHPVRARWPLPCSSSVSLRHAKQLVELTEMADGPHVTTVFTEDEAISPCHHPHQPFVSLRKLDRKCRVVSTPPCQTTHKPNNVLLYRFQSKWTDVLELPKFGAVDEHDIGRNGKRLGQRRPESAPRAGAPHNERSDRSDIHHLKAAQRVREEARA